MKRLRKACQGKQEQEEISHTHVKRDFKVQTCLQHGHNDGDLLGAAEVPCAEEHLGDRGVHGQLAHVLAERAGEGAGVVDGAEGVEQLEAGDQVLGGRRRGELELHHVVDAERLQLQDGGRKVGALHLRRGVEGQLLKVLLGAQPEWQFRVLILCYRFEFGLERVDHTPVALARTRPAGSARPLLRRRLRELRDDERVDVGVRVVPLELDEAGVDDVDDALDGDGGLGDVGGHDDLPAAPHRRAEHLQLVVRRQRAVHGQRPQLQAVLRLLRGPRGVLRLPKYASVFEWLPTFKYIVTLGVTQRLQYA